MREENKDLNESSPSEFCGDGSCGCGCDESIESKQILTKEELQKIRSSLSKESLEVNGNLT